ncbi:hypothetical protein [Asanoa hainanensis]|uniref:hypothetical protein n=1 Tax=Asanoa hainanensis TaxID=560556 RepID=UPI00117D2050|nr:hypothetical protein [Asanoa hainanensis]
MPVRHRLGTGEFMPSDRSTIPPLQYVNVIGYGPEYQRHPGGPGCGETLFDSPLSAAQCFPEPGLVYRRGVVEHGYQVAVRDLVVVVAGPLAMPSGVQYLRADHRTGEESVRIIVFAVRADNGDQCSISTCSPDGPDLKYLRRDDVHGYVLRRGDVIVSAEGGVAVDRELLRRAVFAARPATEAELRRVPPTTPPGDRYDRLRRWLR